MSIGNLKTEGSKGNNFPWQLKMLMGQQCACDALNEIADNTDTVEPLLAQILAAVQQGTDYEAALVVDANDDTWLEIRIWNGVTFDAPVYYLAGSTTAGTPVAPITYINPNTYLAQIVSNTTGLATEATLLDVEVDTTAIAADTAVIAAVDFATETTLASVETNTTGVARTPNFLRPTGVNGNTPVGIFSASFASVGTANATVGGIILKPGETLNLDAGALNNTLGTIAYSTTAVGAELIIIFLI